MHLEPIKHYRTQKVFVQGDGRRGKRKFSSVRLHKNFIQSTHKSCVVEALPSSLAIESRL